MRLGVGFRFFAEDIMKDEILTQALSKRADYSSNFSKVVEELCAKLSQALETEFVYDAHMNYSSAQVIELWLDKAHELVGSRRAALYVVRTFISSKGNFFAIRCTTQYLPRRWRPIPVGEHDESIEAYIQKIEQFLTVEGYVSLPEAVLSQPAKGHLTMLDNLPATVFNVLFSELG